MSEIIDGDYDILKRALAVAEAECAALREERDGFAKTALEQQTEIARLRSIIDGGDSILGNAIVEAAVLISEMVDTMEIEWGVDNKMPIAAREWLKRWAKAEATNGSDK